MLPFRQIVGHDRVRRLLSRSIEQKRLPPSLIFSGPKGVGKRAVALAVAQALNCVNEDAVRRGDACGECVACRRIARAVHSDVLVVRPGDSGDIKIEQTRDVIDRTIYRPFEGRRRVTIIDDADTLMAASQNALLKTLEEPPSASVFILVTSRPDALLPTVSSRCSQIRFGRLSSTDVATILERDHQYKTRDAVAVAAISDGSVGQALNGDAEAFADAREAAEQLLRSAGAKSDARSRIDRAKNLVQRGGATPASEREYLNLRLEALSSLARDIGLLTSGGNPERLANVDLRDELAQISRRFDDDRAVDVFAAIGSAREALERNVSPKVIADWLAVRL
jgi:DNA polymerase III subunit delta'